MLVLGYSDAPQWAHQYGCGLLKAKMTEMREIGENYSPKSQPWKTAWHPPYRSISAGTNLTHNADQRRDNMDVNSERRGAFFILEGEHVGNDHSWDIVVRQNRGFAFTWKKVWEREKSLRAGHLFCWKSWKLKIPLEKLLTAIEIKHIFKRTL